MKGEVEGQRPAANNSLYGMRPLIKTWFRLPDEVATNSLKAFPAAN